MATKWRKFSTNQATKIIAFILAIVSLTMAVAGVQVLVYKYDDLENLFLEEYKYSNEFYYSEITGAVEDMINLIEDPTNKPQKVPYYYYISDGEHIDTNAPNPNRSFFAQNKNAFFAFEDGRWIYGEDTLRKYLPYIDNKHTVYIAFPDKFLQDKQMEWKNLRDQQLPIAISVVAWLLLALLLIILLILGTGRKATDREIHLAKMDFIYSDILFVAMIMFAVFWALFVTNPLFRVNFKRPLVNYLEYKLSVIWVGAFTALFSALCGFILLSLVRKAKAGKLLKHSFIFTVCFSVYDFCKSLFDGRKFSKYPLTKALFYRQMLFIIVSAVLVFFALVFVAAESQLVLGPPVIEVVLIYWFIKGNNKTFDDINKGFNESLEDQMRAERMKIELVTNVSHDLKTPLTSIISYVDLLAKEENLSETASDYVRILVEKSNRLKNIVSDLFDLAKSTSGDIALDMERLDMKKLIEQTLGDMEQDIAQTGLQLKTKLPDQSFTIFADGKKLYRVFQNVIDNALKYSLKGTRVYIELAEQEGKAIATIKNTAGYEMDFTAEEIVQRFTRGDKSRTTEGSGLGLSIAESFTRICGGDFKVDVDGDLFKVTISFKLIDNK